MCPRACGALLYRGSAALASAFTRPCRRGSARFGDSACPGLVTKLRRHRQNHVLATRTESLLQGIDGLTKPRCVEGGSRYVAGARLNRRWHPDKLLLRTIACRAARVVQAVGCPGWVKSAALTVGRSLPVCPDKPTLLAWPATSEKCQKLPLGEWPLLAQSGRWAPFVKLGVVGWR